MADAKKCDICGKLYEKYHITAFGFHINSFKFANDRLSTITMKHDCCPECMQAIVDLISELRGVSEEKEEISDDTNNKRCCTCKFQSNDDEEEPCNRCIKDYRVTYELWQAKE